MIESYIISVPPSANGVKRMPIVISAALAPANLTEKVILFRFLEIVRSRKIRISGGFGRSWRA